MKSLFICGCCGEDTKKTDRDIEKVTLGGYTDMLCHGCRECLNDDISDLARKYLDKKE